MLSEHALFLHDPGLDEVAQNLCLALADQMGPKTIRRKTLAHRIVASLMDLEVVRLLNRSSEVDDWYERMERAYSWSARFWEQRSLGLENAPDRAYSYAKRAVSLHADAFTYNTLGTVLMRRAVGEEDQLGPAQRKSYWREALEALVESRDRGHDRFQHPFTTFFTYTLRLLNVEPNMDRDWLVQAEQAYRDWRTAAAALDFFDDSAMRSIVSEFPHDWRR